MNHNLEIQKLLLKMRDITHPEGKINLLKQAILIADANNDRDWGIDLRIDLIKQEKNTSRCTESFPAFVWLLNTYDTNPELFDEDDFLYEYKWMANSAHCNASIPKEQIEAIMDNLRMRMNSNGYTPRGYYSVMIFWNLFIGNINKAKEYLKLRNESPRDRMSQCPACELNTTVEIELIDGNFDEAIVVANDLIEKRLTCELMPLVTFCNLTHYLAKADDGRAAEYFVKAEEELTGVDENNSFLLSSISGLFTYLIRNEREKAWEYFQRYAHWEVDAEDAIAYSFSASVLPLLKDGGSKELEMSTKLPYYKTDKIYNLEELYNYYRDKASALAQRFDERNGTDVFKKRMAEVLPK